MIHYGRMRLGSRELTSAKLYRDDERSFGISDLAERANSALRHAAEEVTEMAVGDRDKPARKKRKLFNGIGKILAGAIVGGGNILVATATIAAPNPLLFGLIGSSAVAVGGILQGIGDLRGE